MRGNPINVTRKFYDVTFISRFVTSVLHLHKAQNVRACHIWAAAHQNQQNDLIAQRSLRSAWASAQYDRSSLSTWQSIVFLATHKSHIEDSDQTGQMPRLIWVFAVRTHHFVGFVMLLWGKTTQILG